MTRNAMIAPGRHGARDGKSVVADVGSLLKTTPGFAMGSRTILQSMSLQSECRHLEVGCTVKSAHFNFLNCG